MVTVAEQTKEIVVVLANGSLTRPLSSWADRHAGWSVRLVDSGDKAAVLGALLHADFCLIEATECPERALTILNAAAELLDGRSIAVYTEVARQEVEAAARRNWGLYTFGPMTDDEWDAFLPGGNHEPPPFWA